MSLDWLHSKLSRCPWIEIYFGSFRWLKIRLKMSPWKTSGVESGPHNKGLSNRLYAAMTTYAKVAFGCLCLRLVGKTIDYISWLFDFVTDFEWHQSYSLGTTSKGRGRLLKLVNQSRFYVHRLSQHWVPVGPRVKKLVDIHYFLMSF